MDQLKKNLFWIILGIVVLGAVGAWFIFMPDLDAAKADATKKAADLSKAASDAKKADGLKTEAHVKAAETIIKRLDAEKKALIDTIKAWPDFSPASLNKRYADAPPATKNIEFDIWMDAQRKRVKKKLADASIAVYADFDKTLSADWHIDKDLSLKPVDLNNKSCARHRDFQLRILAIVDDVVEALVPRTGVMPITKFETDPARQESTETAQTGALELAGFVFHGPDDTAKFDAKGYENALTRSGWKRPVSTTASPDAAGFRGIVLPVSVTSVEVVFISHVSAIPTILKRFESGEKYMAVLTTSDFERTAQLFPGVPTEAKAQQDYAKAAFNPMLNTHYGEAPVKAYAMLQFYEFDKAKADKMDAPPPAATKPKPK